jgi:nitroreductase
MAWLCMSTSVVASGRHRKSWTAAASPKTARLGLLGLPKTRSVDGSMSRTAGHPIEPMFVRRWSGRAMSGEPVARSELLRLFESARWAPSASNGQPWRMLYAIANTPEFALFFDLLAEGNRTWCARAGALIVMLSRTSLDGGQPSRTHSFDAGAAWMSLALQGLAQRLVVHAMAGFDHGRAREVLRVPDGIEVECMIAVGHPGRLEDLPEHLRLRENPSDRQPVESFAFEGSWPVDARGN